MSDSASESYEIAARRLRALSARYHDASLRHPEQREPLEVIAQHFTLAANTLLLDSTDNDG